MHSYWRNASALSTLLITFTLSAQNEPLWLRQPAISPDGSSIVFTYQGDLWRVDAKGGSAQLLTTSEALDANPVWSHNGKQIAFSSDRSGNNDVYVMPGEGGPATRLTFHSAGDMPTDFTPNDSAIIFSSQRLDAASNQLFPVGGLGELYRVPVKGGRAFQLLTTPALSAHFNVSGDLLVYHDVKGYEDELRKHHTSSVTRDVWTYDLKNKTYTQLTTFNGEDMDPIFSTNGKTIYYLSEEKGTFNIFKRPVDGASTQVSFLKEHPVRGLSVSNGGVLCFSYRGELYTMTEGAEPQKVVVRIAADDRYRNERIGSVGEADEMSVSPNGKEIVFIHRGEVFVTSVAEGTTRRITNTPEQERSASFSPDGRTILYASERNGSWDLYTTKLTRKEENYFFNATVLKEEPLLTTPAEEFQPAYSPDGKEVAYLEERTAIKVLNLASKATRTIMPSDKNYSYSDGDQYFDWSPDSKWLLVEFLHPDQWITQCGLVSAEGGKEIIDLTHSGYGGYHPQWALDGKAMTWISQRDGMKNHASWGGQLDAYMLFFTQAEYDAYKLNKEEAELKKEANEEKEEGPSEKKEKDKNKEKEKEEENKKIEPLKFELAGIDERKVRLTPHSSDLSSIALSKDGEKLYYIAKFEKSYDLWQAELRTHETKVLAALGKDNAGDLQMDKDGKNLFFIAEKGISKLEIEKAEVKPVGINGEMVLNESKERAYLFEHVWRQVLKKFYTPDLHGVDWNALKLEYARFLPSINNNHDFADMLSEMLGELNASHTGAGFRPDVKNGDATACLGLFYADPEKPESGLRITEVMENSPVIKEGGKIKAGHIIEQIDGVVLTADMDPSKLLNRKAGKPTLLAMFDPKTNTRWVESVKPIGRGEERQLLYKRWVKRCRHIVDSLSGGTIGYVHVRGMDDESYRTVYDDALGRSYDKKALVVDTRFNGGGWLHDDLATFLSGKTYMREEPRGQKLGTEPQFKWQRPSIVVMSESNYSDAHMFPVTYKALGIGKLVGMPVPGTGTAVWWEGLQNDMWFGIPQVGMVDMQGKFLENQQLEPDVRQALDPAIVSHGRDQQLEAAVKELQQQLKK